MRKICSYTAMMIAILSVVVAQTHGQAISTTESILDFGNVTTGESASDIVTVTNASNFEIFISASIEPGNGFRTDLPDFVFMLPGTSKDINVYFEPTANGVVSDVLVIDVIVEETPEDDEDPFEYEQAFVDLIGTGGESTNPGDLVYDILAFYDGSISDGTLVGTGYCPSRRERALRYRIRAIGYLIEHGYYYHASYITHTAIRRTDGEPCPRDFVVGSSLDELNAQLVLLKMLLDS